jgi:hypothetical protein
VTECRVEAVKTALTTCPSMFWRVMWTKLSFKELLRRVLVLQFWTCDAYRFVKWKNLIQLFIISCTFIPLGDAVGWGTALQAGRSLVRFTMLSLEFFININGSTMALGLTQPLTEVSTGNISWGIKAASMYGWQLYHHYVPTVLKSGSLKLLDFAGPFQACTRIALPFIRTCNIWGNYLVVNTPRLHYQHQTANVVSWGCHCL